MRCSAHRWRRRAEPTVRRIRHLEGVLFCGVLFSSRSLTRATITPMLRLVVASKSIEQGRWLLRQSVLQPPQVRLVERWQTPME